MTNNGPTDRDDHLRRAGLEDGGPLDAFQGEVHIFLYPSTGAPRPTVSADSAPSNQQALRAWENTPSDGPSRATVPAYALAGGMLGGIFWVASSWVAGLAILALTSVFNGIYAFSLGTRRRQRGG